MLIVVDTEQLVNHVKQLEHEIMTLKESYGALAMKVLFDWQIIVMVTCFIDGQD